MLQGREKIRRTKAKLGLNLATVVKDNEISFYKYIGNKGTVKEILHPPLDAVLWMQHFDMARGNGWGTLFPFFPSVRNTRTSCPQATHIPKLEICDGELNEALIIHEEMVSDLCQLDLCPQV